MDRLLTLTAQTERPTTQKSADLFVYNDTDLCTPSHSHHSPIYRNGRTLVASMPTRCALVWQSGVRASCAAVLSLTWRPSCGVKWCPAPPARPAPPTPSQISSAGHTLTAPPTATPPHCAHTTPGWRGGVRRSTEARSATAPAGRHHNYQGGAEWRRPQQLRCAAPAGAGSYNLPTAQHTITSGRHSVHNQPTPLSLSLHPQ